MEFGDWERNTFKVKAIQLTKENISEVAQMLGTYVEYDRFKYGDRPFIRLNTGMVHGRPVSADAMVGDWITAAGGNLKDLRVYRVKKFTALFRKHVSEAEKREKLSQMLMDSLSVEIEFHDELQEEVKSLTDRVMNLFSGVEL